LRFSSTPNWILDCRFSRLHCRHI